ncbi:hypothetical protein GCM10023184_43560 [Flaviaesturariibacter amylovorans]|uniref:DUF4212 domain-containing protein n=2 Tax=Flaviaesturariibacter amylovorans TaxID=1084520 RepID=A0ABP8HRP7_9BACT
MDPKMRRHLKKVMNTLFLGLFWMFFMTLFGFALGWAVPLQGGVDGFNIFFYLFAVVSFAALLRYYYKLWK